MAISIRSLLSTFLVSAGFLISASSANALPIRSFTPINRYVVDGAVAEIIAATPDGMTVVYTNSDDENIGLLDISKPSIPQVIGTVDVSAFGEPTSVAVTPNGQYALVSVLDKTKKIANQKPGTLVFINLQTQSIVGQVKLAGIGPDSLAITPDGSKAIIAIEDEEDEDNLPGKRPGSVNFITINYNNPNLSQVNNVALNLEGIDGVNYQKDPQPEFVAISKDGKTAAISIQENNAIAILDVASEKVIRIFSAGTSKHKRADLKKDKKISFTQSFEGRREPDALAFTADGKYIITANEGDTKQKTFKDGIYSGGRGWSIFDLEGNVVYDTGSSLEEEAVIRGHYPDGRSKKRGIEVEGVAVASFNNQEFAFVASERGSFLAVYDLSNIKYPQLVSFLPTGMAPEGILPIPQRNLVLTANEKDGTIDTFRGSMFGFNPYKTNVEPDVVGSLENPYAALSGWTQVPGNPNKFYAVPDNAVAPSKIFSLELQGKKLVVTDAMELTKNGKAAKYDLEGITVASNGGFWVVSEGDNRKGKERPNVLVKLSAQGEVEQEVFLPQNAAAKIQRFGFEGVTTSADGSKVYVAIQREFKGEDKVRIAEYNVATKNWNYYFYSLDTDNKKGWVGNSEIARDIDGSFLVIERDNQGGKKGASNVRVKRIYRFSLDGVRPRETVNKQLVADLTKDYNWYEEKVEGLAVTNNGYWVISDNDGGTISTRALFIGR